MTNKKSLLILLVIICVFSFFNILKIFLLSDNNFSEVIIPRIISDDYFYYARIKEIKDGYPFLGNPFYFEHRLDTNTTFFLPDFFAVLPYLLNFSFFCSFSINLFVWSLITALILYYLFYAMHFTPKICLIGSIFVSMSTIELFFRPTILQVVYPFFILGLIILYHWLQEKISNKLFFITSLLFTFGLYFYQHLAIILYFLGGTMAIYFLFIKKVKKFIQLSTSILISLILAIPLLVHYYLLAKNNIFNELLLRIDEVFTHVPSFFVFMSGKWVIIAIVIWFFIFKLSENNKEEKKISSFFIFLGIASILAAASNIFTGVRVEIAEHIYRFQKIYISITVFLLLVYILKYWRKYLQVNKWLFYFTILFLLILLVTYSSIGFHSFNSIRVSSLDIKRFQDYKNIITELNKLPNESVILANEELSVLIPVYTKHYDLFARDGNAYLISNNEIMERYLLSHIFDDSHHDFQLDIGLIIGYGREYDHHKEHNRWVGFCNRCNLNFFNIDCGKQKSNLDELEPNFFLDMEERYIDTKNNHVEYLNKYNVKYLLIDTKEDIQWKNFDFQQYPFELIYFDGRFKLYNFIINYN